ncbi:MAG: histidine kinase [Balneolia bacterium]|nr:histidine kinase [Balneolia bacterium]
MTRLPLFSLSLFLLILLLPAFLTDSQLQAQYAQQRWTVQSGLPSNDIFDIAQTPDGFIWLATDNGLARFDGVNFTIFDRTNTPEITRSVIRKLFVSEDGTLYIGMSGGGVVTYRDNSFFREFDEFIDDGTYVLSFGENEDGLWIGADGSGLFLATGDTVLSWQEPDIPRNHIFALQRFSGEKMAMGIIVNGVWISDNLNFRSTSTPVNELIYDFTPDGDRLWLSTAGRGVFLYENNEFTNFPMRGYSESSHVTTAIKKDSSGRIWVGTAEGIFYTDDEFETVSAYPGLERSFSLSIMEDREGNIWIADWGGGILRLAPATFSAITTADGLPDGATSSAAWFDDSLWIATQFGLYSRNDDGYRVLTSVDGMHSSNPHLLLADSQNQLLVAYFGPGGGIDIYQNGVFTRHPLFEDGSYSTISMLSLYEDRDGALLIGANVGLARWHNGEATFVNSAQGLANNTVRSILRQGDTIWLGTNGGLHALYDIETEPRAEFISAPGGTMGSVITALHTDEDDNLWVGTFDFGLTLIRDGEFYNFNTGNGLPTDVIWQIVEDDQGYFWMGSTTGITRVNRNQLLDSIEEGDPHADAIRFTRNDGLLAEAIYGNHQPTVLQHDGNIYFPAGIGMAHADPSKVVLNTTPPTAVIQQILLDLEPYQPGDSGEIVVSHQVRALEIQYTSPTFTAPSDVRFKYRLKPYDSQWQEVGTRRAAYYTSIPHGRYTFEVKAINENGIESITAATIPVRVLPAFWETWWFYSGLVFMVFGIAYGSYRYKVYNFTRLNNLRIRISKDLHDEIGSNLASIAIRSSVVKKREHTSPQTAEDLDEIRNLSRLTAESMRDIVWLINPDNDKMENLLIKLREVVSNMLMETKWTFDSNIDDTNFTLQIQKRRTIILIAKEVIHNIVKHAQAGQVNVRFHQRDGMLSLSISDDGKGFDPEHITSSGLGLRSMRERAAEVGGTLNLRTSPGRGTTITLDIPV